MRWCENLVHFPHDIIIGISDQIICLLSLILYLDELIDEMYIMYVCACVRLYVYPCIDFHLFSSFLLLHTFFQASFNLHISIGYKKKNHINIVLYQTLHIHTVFRFLLFLSQTSRFFFLLLLTLNSIKNNKI